MNPQFPADIGVASHSDVGLVRQANEDSYLVVDPSDPQVKQSRGQLVIVADGMGGHVGGATASRIVVETVATTYMNDHQTPIAQSLGVAVEEANRAVHAESQRNLELHKMGSTCTALVIHQGFAYLAHVGDSRCYLVRNGQLQQLTVDHSKVGLLVASGMITPEEAETHPEKNVILRSMGPKPHVDVDILPEPFQLMEGDRLVLCSDGLNAHVRDPMIAQMVQSYPIEEATRQLVEAAKMGGGTDNITVAVVRVGPDIPAGVRAPSPVPLSQPKTPSSSSNNDQMRVIGGIVIGMLLAALLFMAFSGGDSKESGDGDESQDDVVHSDDQGSENPDARDPLADREPDEDEPLPELAELETTCPGKEALEDEQVCSAFEVRDFEAIKDRGVPFTFAMELTACAGWEDACDGQLKSFIESEFRDDCEKKRRTQGKKCSAWADFSHVLKTDVVAVLSDEIKECRQTARKRKRALDLYEKNKALYKEKETRDPRIWERYDQRYRGLCGVEPGKYEAQRADLARKTRNKANQLDDRIEFAKEFMDTYAESTKDYPELKKLSSTLTAHKGKLQEIESLVDSARQKIEELGPLYQRLMALPKRTEKNKNKHISKIGLEIKLKSKLEKPLKKACKGKMRKKSVEELEAIAEWKKWRLDELKPQCFKTAMEQLQAKKKSSPENPEPDPADN